MQLSEILELSKAHSAGIRLCAFDFDSTLMDGETIDLLAQAYGVGDKVKDITAEAMSGKLDFFQSLTARVALLKGMPCAKVSEVCANLPLVKGVTELIPYLKSKNIKVIVLSGGFHEAIDHAHRKLDFDFVAANFLHAQDGALTGLVGGEMMRSDSKGSMLARIKRLLGLRTSEVACVGDGANDLAMFKESGFKIAFCAKPILNTQADLVIDTKDLSRLMAKIQR